MKKRVVKYVLAIVALCACFMGGCGRTAKELPDNDPLNNGLIAIMETENGYYSNLYGHQCLRYYDKNSGAEIFLCGKPECQHQGDDKCVATYKGLKTINSVLYGDMIYTLAVEEQDSTISFQLYKIALDGSSMDKVGEVFSSENAKDAEYKTAPSRESAFIIHRGYAYIPFYLTFGNASSGFAGGGLVRMDIKTGRTEQIYNMEHRQSKYPVNLRAAGDYVYYELGAGFHSAIHGSGPTNRYSLIDGTIASPLGEDSDNVITDFETADRLYKMVVVAFQEKEAEQVIDVYDSETGQRLEEESVILQGLEPRDRGRKLMLYEDHFYLCGNRDVLVYSKEGKFVTDISFELKADEGEYADDRVVYVGQPELDSFHIVNGKLYRTRRTNYSLYTNKDNAYHVYACDIKKLLDGKGEWEEVYSMKGWWVFSENINAMFEGY